MNETFKLNIFEPTEIKLNELVNLDLLEFIDGRTVMTLLDSYLKSKGILLDTKGRYILEDLICDFRYKSKGKADLRPSFVKGVGREGILQSREIVDLFFLVEKVNQSLILTPYIPNRGETKICQEA